MGLLKEALEREVFLEVCGVGDIVVGECCAGFVTEGNGRGCSGRFGNFGTLRSCVKVVGVEQR